MKATLCPLCQEKLPLTKKAHRFRCVHCGAKLGSNWILVGFVFGPIIGSQAGLYTGGSFLTLTGFIELLMLVSALVVIFMLTVIFSPVKLISPLPHKPYPAPNTDPIPWYMSPFVWVLPFCIALIIVALRI